MNLFVVVDEYTLFMFIYLRSSTFMLSEDEYTYYLHQYILGYEPFSRMEDEYTLFTFIYLRS